MPKDLKDPNCSVWAPSRAVSAAHQLVGAGSHQNHWFCMAPEFRGSALPLFTPTLFLMLNLGQGKLRMNNSTHHLSIQAA